MPGWSLKIRKRSAGYDDQAITVLGYTLFFSAGTYCAKAIVTGLGMPMLSQVSSALVYLGWFMVLLYFVMQNYYIIGNILLAETVYLAFLLVNMSLFPYTREMFDEFIMFIRQIIVVYIPCGVICSKVTDFSDVFKKLRIWGYVGTGMMVIAYMLGYVEINGGQYLGVQLTPFIIILFVEFCQRKTVYNVVALLLGILLILVGGRQSLMIVGVSALAIYIFLNKEHKKKMIMASVFTVTVLLFLALFIEDILRIALALFEQAGLNTRIVEALLSGELLSTQTRKVIYETAIKVIEQKGAAYTGPFSGIYLIRTEGSDWMVYPHNIVLELLMDYGTVLGGVILLALILLMIKSVLKGAEDRRLLMTCLIAMSMGRLMVSSSYLIEGNFYVMLIMLLMGRPRKAKGRRLIGEEYVLYDKNAGKKSVW